MRVYVGVSRRSRRLTLETPLSLRTISSWAHKRREILAASRGAQQSKSLVISCRSERLWSGQSSIRATFCRIKALREFAWLVCRQQVSLLAGSVLYVLLVDMVKGTYIGGTVKKEGMDAATLNTRSEEGQKEKDRRISPNLGEQARSLLIGTVFFLRPVSEGTGLQYRVYRDDDEYTGNTSAKATIETQVSGLYMPSFPGTQMFCLFMLL